MAQQQKKSMLTLELICEFEKERDFCVKEGILMFKSQHNPKSSYLEEKPTYNSIEKLGRKEMKWRIWLAKVIIFKPKLV